MVPYNGPYTSRVVTIVIDLDYSKLPIDFVNRKSSILRSVISQQAIKYY